ncbi:MAG: hypothetical protein ABIZ07_00925 [Dermatophilaceae bacterium]
MLTEYQPATESGNPLRSLSLTPAHRDAAELRLRSVRELIAELAELETASPSTTAPSGEGDGVWPRTREGRIVAELRRRHAALRRWTFAESRVAAGRAGNPSPAGSAMDPHGQWRASG